MDPSSTQLIPHDSRLSNQLITLDRSLSPTQTNPRASFPPSPKDKRFRKLAQSAKESELSVQKISKILAIRNKLKEINPHESEFITTTLASNDSSEDSPPRITLNSSSPKVRRNGQIVNQSSMTIFYNRPTNPLRETEEIEQDGVSEEFIDAYNRIFGDLGMRTQAENLTKKMRRLAGLDPSEYPINISQARIGLCLLARIKNEMLKAIALDSLIELLMNDSLTQETSENLSTFASNFFNLITRKEFKLERPPIQQKIGAVYDLLLPILQAQFEKERLAPITSELKSQLTLAGIVLGKVKQQTIFDTLEYSIDVPQARIDLCNIAADPDENTKIEALNNLEYILRNDPCSQETASRLVELAINYLKLIDRDEFQLETPNVQLKIVTVYNALILLLNSQYANEHIRAITSELKSSLVSSPKKLRRLNSHNSISFEFNAQCALEGSRRLIDDRQELFAYIKRGLQIVTGLVSIGLQEVDEGVSRIENELRKIDIRGTSKWYDNVLILEKLGKEAFKSRHLLNETQHFIALKNPGKDKKHTVDRWEFYYTAAKLLRDTCLNGETSAIRLRALTGGKYNYPSLKNLLSFEFKDKKGKTEKIKEGKRDTNLYIRDFAIDCLVEIVNTSKDKDLITDAKTLLEQRIQDEKDQKLVDKLSNLTFKNDQKAKHFSF